MLNANVILAIVKDYTNKNNEIKEDKFLDLVSGLEEEEVNEVLEVFAKNRIHVVEEITSMTNNNYEVYKKLQNLTNEELCVMYQRGDKNALEALIVNNEKLVKKIASKVLREYRPEILEAEDLYSAGNLGLMKAAEKYEVSMGNKFSTYACWWIRQNITRDVMDNGYGMRLPVHVFEQVIKVNKVRKMLNGGTAESIAEILNSDFGKNYTIEEVERLIMYGDQYLNTASLNKYVGNDEDGTELMSLIPLEVNVEDEVMDKIAAEEIEKVLSTLSEKENKIIHMRFGLAGYNPMTLEEIGEIYQVTRERIRQIEAKALNKLRQTSRSSRLEVFYAA